MTEVSITADANIASAETTDAAAAAAKHDSAAVPGFTCARFFASTHENGSSECAINEASATHGTITDAASAAAAAQYTAYANGAPQNDAAKAEANTNAKATGTGRKNLFNARKKREPNPQSLI